MLLCFLDMGVRYGHTAVVSQMGEMWTFGGWGIGFHKHYDHVFKIIIVDDIDHISDKYCNDDFVVVYFVVRILHHYDLFHIVLVDNDHHLNLLNIFVVDDIVHISDKYHHPDRFVDTLLNNIIFIFVYLRHIQHVDNHVIDINIGDNNLYIHFIVLFVIFKHDLEFVGTCHGNDNEDREQDIDHDDNGDDGKHPRDTLHDIVDDVFADHDQLGNTADSELMREIVSLIGQLTQDGGETFSATLPANSSNSSFLPLIVENSPAAAVLPQELVEEVKLRYCRGWGPEAAVPAVDISIVDVESLGVREVQGARTFFVRIAETPPDPEWICAYLDGDSWSTEGVRLATASELEAALGGSADTSGVWCATVHLSIFGAFVDILLDCTNANMLTPEGLREIIDRQGWPSGKQDSFSKRRQNLDAPRLCSCRSGKKVSKVAAGLREFVIYRNTLWEDPRLWELWYIPYYGYPEVQKHFVMISDGLPAEPGKSGWIQGSLAMQASPKLKELAIKLEEGSLAFVALFFSVDGSAVGARSPEECPIEQGSFLWYTFVALFSVLLNCVPRSYLLVVTAFLANLSEVDEAKWMFSFAVVVVRKLVVVPVLATLLSSVGTELSICALSGEALSPPKKFGLDLQLATDGKEAGSSTAEESEGAASEVWHQKVRDLAGRGISVRQLLDFYADLGQRTMKHFEPHQSTTHDVVRQVIIPNSLQLREARFFFVLLRQVTSLAGASKPYCRVSVRGPTAELKPWKGGGCAAPGANKREAWDSQIVAEDVEREDRLFLELLDDGAPPDLRNLGNLELPASRFWHGLRAELQLSASQDIKLQVEISAHKTVEEAKKVAQKANEVHGSAPKSKWSPIALPWRHQRDHDIAIDLSDTDERVLSIESPRRYTMTIASWPKDDGEGPRPSSASQGHAYATVVNNGQPYLAQKMVTHGWRNKFTYLLAAIFADALDLEMYDEVAELLAERQFGKLASALRRKGKLDIRYWVCAFCVNQHTGICATPPPTDSSGFAITPCSCGTSKSFTGDLSEMNKFDDMMAYLKKTLRAQGRVRLEQVVALETDFSLLTRVWCLAELLEAYEVHLPQAVKIHSAASRDVCLERLAKLDVRDAEASFPADKELVLSKIDDMDDFNLGLQNLVMHRLEQFLQGNRACSAASLFDNVVLAALSVTM
ncbi:unnamed protein product [Symbiodinium sp. KB8]|nr:unnamed protein product [Symbiodinium sp. KB8]